MERARDYSESNLTLINKTITTILLLLNNYNNNTTMTFKPHSIAFYIHFTF